MDEKGFWASSSLTKIMTVKNHNCSESMIHVISCNSQSKQETEKIMCNQQMCEFSALYSDGSNSNAALYNLSTASNTDQINSRVANIKSMDGEEVLGSTLTDQSNRQTDMVGLWQADCKQVSVQQANCNKYHDEIERRAREEGCVNVVFPGSVMQNGCCRFVCELLKFILYQRQQLPMTYDQMVFFQKQQYAAIQPEATAVRKPSKSTGDLNWKSGQRTLRELEEVLGNLEALFSLSCVPRVLIMLGGSLVLPTELYEINMEALEVGEGDNNLRTSVCLRQLFHTLFMADLLSDVKPVRLMATTVMVFGHRDCGVEWFKPKIDFQVPTRKKHQVITLASNSSVSSSKRGNIRDWKDYIWFQSPVTIKGFC